MTKQGYRIRAADPLRPSADFETAAREMARLIDTPCWLVPIPASDGSPCANTILAAHIARHGAGAQVAKAIRRTRPATQPEAEPVAA